MLEKNNRILDIYTRLLKGESLSKAELQLNMEPRLKVFREIWTIFANILYIGCMRMDTSRKLFMTVNRNAIVWKKG